MSTDKKVLKRSLNAGDAKYIATILASEMGKFGPISEIPEEDKSARTEAAAEILQEVLSVRLEEIWDWLADLAGMNSDELDASPLHTPFTLIADIGESEDFNDFLGSVARLLRLFSKKKEDKKDSS